jgi:F0F1-type ATP synthase assembly protein I
LLSVTLDGGLPQDKAESKNPRLVKIAKYMAIGLQFPSTIFGGVMVGYLVDTFLGTSPWFLIGMTFFAFVGAVIQLVRLVRRLEADKR